MAKLLSYYRLCPLIDIKNLLGITEDNEKGVVIVTLGRNIAIKYRLSDQKQICSWRTKEKFSSPVHYNKELGKYVAVFNQTFVRFWTEEEETLDKVKKYKFSQSIQTVFIHNEKTFIVFKTGSVYPLNEILETRKSFSPAVIIEDSEIHDIIYTSLDEDLYFGVVVKTNEGFMLYWTAYTCYSKNVFSKNKLFIENNTLKGYALFANGKKVCLLTVWSDSKMYSKDLVYHDKEQLDVGELFTALGNISTQHFVKVVPLDDKHIGIYGSDPNEEGAILLIYNTQFRVTQSRQAHKLYTEEAKIWQTYNFIFLPVGQNLIAVPFCLESEQLVSLIGSHKSIQSRIDSDIAFVTDFEVADWNEDNRETVSSKKKKKPKKNADKIECERQLPSLLQSKLDELFKEGLPEAAIIEKIIPEILEEGNVKILEEIVNFFTDLPERFLAKILQFTLSCDKKKFKKNSSKYYINLPEELLPFERIKLLDKVLLRRFSNTLLLPHLRSELSVDHASVLLSYLVYQLSEDGHDLPSLSSAKTERFIINWISAVIDSSYQKFVLSKDSRIENIIVKCKDAVLEHLDVLENLKEVEPVLARFEAEAKGRSYASGKLANCLYSIEQIDY